MNHRILSFSLFLAVLNAPASSVHAATNGFVLPSFRGSANSEAGYWETFTVPFGSPGNLPDRPGATTGAVLTQQNTNGFLTGSGNLYNPTELSSFTLTDTTPFALGTVVLQARSLGSELDYSAIALNYTDALGAHSLAPQYRLELARSAATGMNVSSLWQWDLRNLGVNDYTITFAAAAPSLSFDSMTLDTWNQFAVVPEPTTIVLGALGASGFLLCRAGKRRRSA